MSTVKQLADDEATRAETEPEPEPEEEEEPEPEPEPEPPEEPEPKSEKQIEQAMSKLEAEAVRHANRVAEIMGGDFAQLVPCPLDFTPGYVFPTAMPALEQAQLDWLKGLLGVPVTPAYREAEDAQRCGRCDGWGKVVTGARTVEGETKACAACGGLGWVNRPVVVPSPPPVGQPADAAPPLAVYVPPGAPPAPQPYYDYGSGTWKLP